MAAGVEKSRLFLIPGNHDVDRNAGVGLARTFDSREQANTYTRPDRTHPHLTLKLRAFLDWHKSYFDGVRSLPENTTCWAAPLVEVNGHKLGILLLNSALFCQGDDDHDKLRIGRRCLETALVELKEIGADVNIALMHHPLEWLNAIEGSNIQAEIEATVDILLRGHLHETRLESVVSAEGELLRCAAGAAYQSRKWPNRALYGRLDGGELTVFPIRFEDSPLPIWTTDPSVFPRDPNHERTFSLRRSSVQAGRLAPLAPLAATVRFRSNVGSRGTKPFVGRDDVIAAIAGTFGAAAAECVVVLHGQPGVGKSELAREFARQHRDRYPGGTFWVDASTDAIAIHLAGIGKNILDLHFPSDLPLDDQGRQTFQSFGGAPTLLIYDNVVAFDRLEPWLPLSGMPCHVLITTLQDTASVAWPCIEVKPLTRPQSVELVEKLTSPELAARYGEAIAECRRTPGTDCAGGGHARL